MKFVVDQAVCIGCGLCTSICPNVFEMQDIGKAAAVSLPDISDVASAEEAKSSCPVEAISSEG